MEAIEYFKEQQELTVNLKQKMLINNRRKLFKRENFSRDETHLIMGWKTSGAKPKKGARRLN